jgi:hypothetical protein
MLVPRVLRVVAWIFLLAALVCAGFGVWDWREADRISAVQAGGEGAIARIDSGRRVSWKGAAAYAINLSWTDGARKKRQAQAVPVTSSYAGEIVRGGQLVTLAVPIKYMVDDPTAAPVVVPDADRRKAELSARVYWFVSLAFAALLVFVGCRVAARVWGSGQVQFSR